MTSKGPSKLYMRTMVPHIEEMHRQFGSITLENEIQQISDSALPCEKWSGQAMMTMSPRPNLVDQRDSDVQLMSWR